jgi:two-component system CheB/CheR fusion protein
MSLNVLVVEDNRDGADMLKLMLELMGHDVAVAHNGLDGVRLARRFHPDVVICDIGLPGLNGWDVARELRRNPVSAHTKLIAVSGYGTDEDRIRSRQAGFDCHLVKPAEPEVLQKYLCEEWNR